MDSFRNKGLFSLFYMDTNYVSAGQDSVIGLVTRWTVLGSNPDGVDFFRTRTERPWDPPSFLYNGYGVIPVVKRPGCGVDNNPI